MGNNQKKFLDDAVSALKKDGHILVEDALGDSMSGMSYSVGQLLERFPGIKAGSRPKGLELKYLMEGEPGYQLTKGLLLHRSMQTVILDQKRYRIYPHFMMFLGLMLKKRHKSKA